MLAYDTKSGRIFTHLQGLLVCMNVVSGIMSHDYTGV